MARKKKGIGWRARLLGALLLAALAGAAWGWWTLRHWTPAVADYPEQGAEISPAAGEANYDTLQALGARFVYLDATAGAEFHDPRFAAALAEARKAGLKAGAVHRFDPCLAADGQSANFVTIVPRARDLMPPAIALEDVGEACGATDAVVESELMTLINQIEAHAGKPAILKVGKAFEDRFGLAARIERNLWVEGTWREPTYAKRPWLMWTANEQLLSPASDEPLRWTVVRP